MDLDNFVQNAPRNKGVSYTKTLTMFCKTAARAGHTSSTLMMLVSAVGCSTTATPNLAVFFRRAGRRDLKENGEITLWVTIRGPSNCEGVIKNHETPSGR